jgi:phage terminase small subunit
VQRFVLEEHHLRILTLAAEAWDRVVESRAAIERDGAYIEGRFGMKAHPALGVERDARRDFRTLVRELGLDLDSPTSPRGPSRWHDSA